MKIYFIYPNSTGQEYIPLGLAHLMAMVDRDRHEIRFFDFTWNHRRDICVRDVVDFKPDVVAVSARSTEARFSLRLAGAIKQRLPETHLIFGGPGPTVEPLRFLQSGAGDGVCIGEGEDALVRFLNNAERGNTFETAGFWFSADGGVVRNPLPPLSPDIDHLSPPDRSLFDVRRYIRARNGTLDLLSSRGCPYDCTYCFNKHTRATVPGYAYRQRGVEPVIQEIESLRSRYPVRRLEFVNDIFSLKKEWVEDFGRLYQKVGRLPFICNMRVELVDDDMAALLKKAGCVELQMGIETGSPQLRREILGRRTSDKAILRAFSAARRHKLETFSYNIVGLPYETESAFRATVNMNRMARPDHVQISIFQPYPGTTLGELCREKGWMGHGYLPASHKTSSIMKYPGRSQSLIRKRKIIFRYLAFDHLNYFTRLLMLLFDFLQDFLLPYRRFIPVSAKRLILRVRELITLNDQ
ncbi:B12-binding domain-containing radical SAM protein [candidate division KSB1 bacterium]